MDAILAFVLKLLSGGLVDRALSYLERKADSETERERVRTQATIEAIRAAVQSNRIMADLNREKLRFPWFWTLISLFVVPLAAWWTAILLDSMFHFGWRIADLPTPELKAMAADMIRWLFFVGTGVGALKLTVTK